MGRRTPQLPPIFIALLLATGCGLVEPGGTQQITPFPWIVSSPEAEGFDTAAYAEARATAAGLGFLKSLVVVRNGRLVSEDYYGVTGGTPWEIHSVTKSVISALVGIAIDRGRLVGVDDRLVDYFPDYVTGETDTLIQDVTLEHLLTMTGGIVSDEESMLDGNYFNLVYTGMQVPLADTPGASFRYSSLGTHFLSGILTRGVGSSLISFTIQELFEPLGIALAFWALDGQGIPYGGTGLGMLPRDMARLGYLYLEGGQIAGERILPEAWVEASLTTRVGGTSSTATIDSFGYGYLWWTGNMNGTPLRYAAGYAGQLIVLFPELQMVVVTTSAFPASEAEGDGRFDALLGWLKIDLLPTVLPIPGVHQLPAFGRDWKG